LCRNIAFARQKPKTVYWKINDLRVHACLFSVIYDRTLMLPGSTTTHENRIYKAAVMPHRGTTSYENADRGTAIYKAAYTTPWYAQRDP
jgi:hypothetical protein